MNMMSKIDAHYIFFKVVLMGTVRCPLTTTFWLFLYSCFFFFFFLGSVFTVLCHFFSVKPTLQKEKKKILNNLQDQFYILFFCLCIFSLNGIYLSTTLTSTGAVLAIFLLEGFLLVDKSLAYSTSNKQVLVQYVIVFFPQKCLEICITSAYIFIR